MRVTSGRHCVITHSIRPRSSAESPAAQRSSGTAGSSARTGVSPGAKTLVGFGGGPPSPSAAPAAPASPPTATPRRRLGRVRRSALPPSGRPPGAPPPSHRWTTTRVPTRVPPNSAHGPTYVRAARVRRAADHTRLPPDNGRSTHTVLPGAARLAPHFRESRSPRRRPPPRCEIRYAGTSARPRRGPLGAGRESGACQPESPATTVWPTCVLASRSWYGIWGKTGSKHP